MNTQVTEYINSSTSEQKQMMTTIRALIHEQVPGVRESFKWSRPVFSKEKDFVYFKTAKSYLTFGIFDFEKIRSHTQLLEGTGKDMRHIKIKNPENLKLDVLKEWLEQMTKV